MLIDGYDEDPLVAGEPLLALPGFWAAYLLWLCEVDEDVEEAEADWFGVTDADVDAAYEALTAEDRWPTFRIPFDGGHTAVVIGRNFPEDPGTEYLITNAEWGRPGFLATIDGHQAGPGLAWRELVHIADNPDSAVPGIHDPHARLLLLLPALGDVDVPPDAEHVIADALVSIGALTDKASALAPRLLDNPMWEPARWSLPAAFHDASERFDGILECDGPMSPRCRLRLARGITRELSNGLARALGTWPS